MLDVLRTKDGSLLVQPPTMHPQNAEIYLSEYYAHPQRYRIVYHRGDFHEWTGNHWTKLARETLESRIAAEFSRARYLKTQKDPETGEEVEVTAGYQISKSRLDELIKFMQLRVLLDESINAPTWLPADDGTPTPDIDPRNLIACRNVLLDATTGETYPHTPLLYNQFSVDYDYDPNAPAPAEWLTFLDNLWGTADPAAILCLQEMTGYFLTQRNDLQKFFVFYGAKRAGKGTITRLIEKLLGGERNVAPTSMADLNSDFGLAGLEDKAVATMGDLRFRSRDDGTAVQRLLSITGGDSIRINQKYKTPVNAKLNLRFLMASNELPQMRDESGALQSRIVLFKFEKSNYGQEDLDLERRLGEELPGIFNWALEGLARLNARGDKGFTMPTSTASDLEVITELTSPTLAFVEECCEVDPDAEIPSRELFAVYAEWCAETRTRVVNDVHFGRNLRAALPQLKSVKRGPRGGQTKFYAGVGLNENGKRYLEAAQVLLSITQRNTASEDDKDQPSF